MGDRSPSFPDKRLVRMGITVYRLKLIVSSFVLLSENFQVEDVIGRDTQELRPNREETGRTRFIELVKYLVLAFRIVLIEVEDRSRGELKLSQYF